MINCRRPRCFYALSFLLALITNWGLADLMALLRSVFLNSVAGFFAFAIATTNLRAEEVQSHGYQWENWVRSTFFDGYEGGYTDEWDVAKAANQKHGNLPISIKFAKYGTSVDLGDALRQFSINEPFLMIIGYWKQEGDRKRIVNIVAPVITPEKWQSLFEPINREDLVALDTMIKNRNLPHREAAQQASQIKNAEPFTEAIMTLNPKIDSKNQRRLQCSLRFNYVFEHLVPGGDRSEQEKPTLFGTNAPPPFVSGPRQFNQEP